MTDPFAELDKPLPQIKVTCTSTDCDNEQHCYLQKRKVEGAHVFGPCRTCKAEPPFDIERLRRRDPADIAHTFGALRHEMIRAHYWTKSFDAAALKRLAKRGGAATVARIPARLRASIGKKAGGFDGRQTGLEGDVVLYAQHATATCCRKCISYWHGIPADRDLAPSELDYCRILVEAYLSARLPEVP